MQGPWLGPWYAAWVKINGSLSISSSIHESMYESVAVERILGKSSWAGGISSFSSFSKGFFSNNKMNVFNM